MSLSSIQLGLTEVWLNLVKSGFAQEDTYQAMDMVTKVNKVSVLQCRATHLPLPALS